MATEMKIAKILAGMTAELVDAVGDRDMFRDWCIKRGKEIEALKAEEPGKMREEVAQLQTDNARMKEFYMAASRESYEMVQCAIELNDLQADYAELAEDNARMNALLDGMSDDDNPFMRAGQHWEDDETAERADE